MPDPFIVDDSGEPTRTTRPGSNPGGTGVGPGGGFGGFGGGSNFGFSGGTPFGANATPNHRRMSLRGGMPINHRAPSDTVPAWLTPGEFVTNDLSSALFAPQLEQMNQVGNQIKMAMGGKVPGYADGGSVCPCCGSDMGGMEGAEGHSLGGWIKKHAWVLPLAAAAAPFALGALGVGAAGAAGAGTAGAGAGAGAAGAAGAGAAGAGAAGTAALGASGAGLTVGPMAAVPATSHFGLGALMSAHPALGAGYVGALKLAPYAPAATDAFMRNRQQAAADEAQRQNEAMQFFMQSRSRGYADGGPVDWQNAPGFVFGGWGGPRTGWSHQPGGTRQSPPQGNGSRPDGTYVTPGLGGAFNQNGQTYDRNGFSGTYDPRNPWAGFSGNLNPGALGAAHRQFGAYGQQGYFNPGGSPQVATAMREGALNDARAYGDQAYLSADVGGLDPAAAAAYRTQALAQAGRGVADRMTAYRADMASRDQDYARSLFDRLTQHQLGADAAARDFNYAKNLGKK